jgi:phosphoenolpyruvate carboxykinase (GTP)
VIPLVYESKDWINGVFAASIIGSETTAAADGQIGAVRRDPMAMLPFCGYNMGDYFQHWLDIGKRVKIPPKIFVVNWFRKSEDGRFMWPGFRDNFRIVKWMMDRIKGKTGARDCEIGLLPEINAIDLTGLDIKKEIMEKLLKVDKEDWRKEVLMIEEFYAKFNGKIPQDLMNCLAQLKKNLKT